jgi:phosphoribosyl-AMP cyclohydrolase
MNDKSMTREAVEEAILTGYATFQSRKDQRLAEKERNKGSLQPLAEEIIRYKEDALVYLVEQVGPRASQVKDATGKYRWSSFSRFREYR